MVVLTLAMGTAAMVEDTGIYAALFTVSLSCFQDSILSSLACFCDGLHRNKNAAATP